MSDSTDSPQRSHASSVGKLVGEEMMCSSITTSSPEITLPVAINENAESEWQDFHNFYATFDASANHAGNSINDLQNLTSSSRDTCRHDMLAWLSDERNINDPNRQFVLDLSQGKLLGEDGQRAMIKHEGRLILINWLDF